MRSLKSCIRTSDPAKRQSEQIDKQIKEDKALSKKIFKLLLLGPGESGKSTIVKQMRILYHDNDGAAVDQSEIIEQRIKDIRKNVKDAILTIVGAMPQLQPPVLLANPDNQQHVAYLMNVATRDNFEYSQEFYDRTEILWRDAGVQQCYKRYNEYQLFDSAKYFLDRIATIRNPDYRPTNQDILRCRVLTSGIYEIRFHVNNIHFHLFDVGGQREERRKWVQCFNDVTSIIFVASCSEYDQQLREDVNQNRLRESLHLFSKVWHNRWLQEVSIILFLNKQDLLEQKIREGRSRLEKYFPEYAYYSTRESAPSSVDQEVHRVRCFIKDQFLSIVRQPQIEWPRPNNQKLKAHYCFPHFTCAVDTENVRAVFNYCRENILLRTLEEYDLLSAGNTHEGTAPRPALAGDLKPAWPEYNIV